MGEAGRLLPGACALSVPEEPALATLVGGGDLTKLGSGAVMAPGSPGGPWSRALADGTALHGPAPALGGLSVLQEDAWHLPHRLCPLTGHMQGMGQGMPMASSTCFPRALRCCSDTASCGLGGATLLWSTHGRGHRLTGTALSLTSGLSPKSLSTEVSKAAASGCVALVHACARTHKTKDQ